MKTIITKEFEFDEQDQAKVLMQSDDMYSMLQEFRNYLRNREKHATLPDVAERELETITDKFTELLDDYNVSLMLD